MTTNKTPIGTRLRPAAVAAGMAMVLSTAAVPRANGATVDFRYSPPEWQTAICLPDDPHKSLVDRSGELLYHYHQGGREVATVSPDL